MQLVYSLLLSLAAVALLPWFAAQAILKRKYLNNLKERLGYLPSSIGAVDRPVIWLHAVSVGEALTSRTLLEAMRRRFPDHRLIVSTTTETGQAIARDQLSAADGACYFPFDWRFSVRGALDRIRPRAVILMESELWFNFLTECRSRKIPVMVANGRISDRSFPRSVRFRFFVRRLYRLVDRFAMQSRTDFERAIALGADPASVRMTGNLKYDIGDADRVDLQAARRLDALFSLSGSRLIVAGSTTEGEEEIVLDAWDLCRRGGEDLRLLIAPRHPERFDAVARLLESRGVDFERRSEAVNNADRVERRAAVVLLDSIGELAAVYRFATLVFVGGSLVPKGGHNILEPALYSKPVIVGPHMENFRDIAAEFRKREALLQLQPGDATELIERLSEGMSSILDDPGLAARLGENARAAVDANRGATSATVDLIAELIGSR
ncbi:MAG: 3-deoxy-D-manno-octulosonic acid transferase [Acidobacteriota bacterium]|nr:MAG: 3-deoxy-D-manno-octulosonic acid transferase [Acidobacteriota bacterium]